MQCSWENPQGVLSLEKSPNRRHDMLHTISVVSLRTAVEEGFNVVDLQSAQTARILIKSKEFQKASEPARVHGDRAYYQSADIA
jgi:hypothetical protein